MGVPMKLLLVGLILAVAEAFNVDIDFPILKESTASSYFGYSVAQHSPDEGSNVYQQILVGAPLATSSDPLLNSYEQTGALYKCPIDLKNQAMVSDCTELEYPDTSLIKADMNIDQNKGLENKTDMWLGVNIRSAGAGNAVLGCGHRYKVVESGTNVYGIGVCYQYKADLEVENTPLSPCSSADIVDLQNSVSGEYGVCEAGMGLDAKNTDYVYSLPGAKNWQGSAFWKGVRPFPSNPVSDIIEIEEAEQYSTYYSYLGSSVVISPYLFGDKKRMAVFGAPREQDIGAVIIFEMSQEGAKFEEADKKIGEKFGSGFGQSVATVDMKMDDHPSLIVGAPFYSNISDANSGGRWEVGGAVYVYFNYGDGIPTGDAVDSRVLLSPGACSFNNAEQCSNAQFGYSIIGIGDINHDGFGDLAVGAPFYGPGAVFIYSGQEKAQKLSFELSQVIMATDLDTSGYLSRPLTGFGVSLSGGQDMDGQGYTDIIVGAHESSSLVVLRSRPVVTITGTIKLNGTQLDPKEKQCLSEPGSGLMCIDFVTCFTATYPDKRDPEEITVSYVLTADSGYDFEANRRTVFDKTKLIDSVKSSQASLRIDGIERCELQKVFVVRVQELLKPIEFKIKYELDIATNAPYDNINKYPIMNIFDSADPGAKPGESTSASTIDFERDCITPSCDTDLGVSAMFTDTENVLPVQDVSGNNEFVFDSNRVKKLNLTIRVKVDSEQDRAYEPHVYIELENDLTYDGMVNNKDSAISCSAGQIVTNTVVCSFGRTLSKGENRTFIITLDYKNLGPSFSSINVTANTTSRDTTTNNNHATLKIKVNVVTDLELLGSATKGAQVMYGAGKIKGASAIQFDNEIGDLVQHTYTVINNGEHGTVSKVTVVISWPYEIAASGEYLLYIIGYPQRVGVPEGSSQCHIQDENINPLKYVITDEETIVANNTQRYKRAADKNTAAIKNSETEDGTTKRFVSLNCKDGTATCFNITCEFLKVEPGAEFRIRIDSRVWNSSLTKDYGDTVDYVEIVSNGFLFIDPSAQVSQPTTDNDYARVITEAEPDIALKKQPEKIAIWIIVVAAAGGLLVLIVIILLFWKCGFFKRNRPMTYGVKVEKQNSKKQQYSSVPQSEQEPLT